MLILRTSFIIELAKKLSICLIASKLKIIVIVIILQIKRLKNYHTLKIEIELQII